MRDGLEVQLQAGLRFQREKPVVPTGWLGTVPWYIGTPSCSGEMPKRAPQAPSRRRCGLARAGLASCATALSSSPPVVARSSHRGHVATPRRPVLILEAGHHVFDSDNYMPSAKVRAHTLELRPFRPV